MPNQKTALNIAIGCIAAIAGILFGYDTGVISGVILFIRQEFHLTSLTMGLVVGTVPAGALCGALISGRIADFLGRRSLLIITAFIYMVGTLGCVISFNLTSLIISRFLVGLGIGISSYTAPLYISEIAPTTWRGMLVSFNQLAITIGIVIAYLVDYFFSAHALWRHMFAIGLIPATLLLIGMLFLPESPRFMAYRGRMDQARHILRRIRPDNAIADYELEQIITTSKANAHWYLLLQHWVRPALLIAIGLAVLQQITGINTIIYYAPTIFLISGFHSEQAALFATLGIGMVNVLATIISLVFIDRWGRRPLLFLGTSMMSLSLLALSYIFYTHQTNNSSHFFAFTSIIIYIIGFAISLGPIAWLMIVEIFPLEIRGLGSSIGTACNWAANMLVGLSFLSLIHWLHTSGTFLLFAVISLLTIVFVYFIVPETKGISLETIERNLRARRPARDLGEWLES